ncbi:DUF6514 family protein [Caloramator sp. mosi_1]|uniref:DUF6514 family protein n=1 Tax=Caloramator sp. mosi_1 TaxID=3023090 RepID=UPI003FCC6C73
MDFVSTDRTKVLKLLIDLQKNEVSPIHLIEVVGEYVDFESATQVKCYLSK